MKQNQKFALVVITVAALLLIASLILIWHGVNWQAAAGVFLAIWATNLMRTYSDKIF